MAGGRGIRTGDDVRVLCEDLEGDWAVVLAVAVLVKVQAREILDRQRRARHRVCLELLHRLQQCARTVAQPVSE